MAARGGTLSARAHVLFDVVRNANESPCIAFRASCLLRAATHATSEAARELRDAWSGDVPVGHRLSLMEMLCLMTAVTFETQDDDLTVFHSLGRTIRRLRCIGRQALCHAQLALCELSDWRLRIETPFTMLMQIPTTDAEWAEASALAQDAVVDGVVCPPTVLALACLAEAARCVASGLRDARARAQDAATHINAGTGDVDAALLLAQRFEGAPRRAAAWPRARPPTPPPPASPVAWACLPENFTGDDAYSTLETPYNPRKRLCRPRYQHAKANNST
jgi:hypothetical protein